VPLAEVNNAQCGSAEISLSAEEWDAIFTEGSTSLDTPPSSGSLSRQSPGVSDATEREDPTQVTPDETSCASREPTSGNVSQEKGKAREALEATIPAQDNISPDFNPTLFSMALEEAECEYAQFIGSGINSFGIGGSGALGFHEAGNVQEPSSMEENKLQAIPGYEWQSDEELTQLLGAALEDSDSGDAEHPTYDSVPGLEEVQTPEANQEELNEIEDYDFEDAPLTLITDPSSSVGDHYILSQEDSTWEAYPIGRTPSFSSLFGNYRDSPERASPQGSSQIEIFVPSPAPDGEARPINSPDHDSEMELDSSTEYDEDTSEDEGMGVDYSNLEIADDDMEEDEETEPDANEDGAEGGVSTDAATGRCTREGSEEGETYDYSSDTSDEDMDHSEGPPGDMTPENATDESTAMNNSSPVPESPHPINAYVSPPTRARADSETPLYQRNSVYWEGQASTAHTVYPQPWEVEVNEQARILVYNGQIYQLMDYS
jgi:hypothetical protein